MPLNPYKMRALLLIYGLFAPMLLWAQARDTCDMVASGKRKHPIMNQDSVKGALRAISYLYVERRTDFFGTAFLIHPQVLLTAGHNLVRTHRKKRARFFSLRLGASWKSTYLTQRRYRVRYGRNVEVSAAYAEKRDSRTDYALIFLPDSSLFQKAGHCFRLRPFDSSALINRTLYQAGYPRHRNENGFFWRDSTQNFALHEGFLRSDFYTAGGASGSPIWYEYAGQHIAVAVHTRGNRKHRTCSFAIPITDELYREIADICLRHGFELGESP